MITVEGVDDLKNDVGDGDAKKEPGVLANLLVDSVAFDSTVIELEVGNLGACVVLGLNDCVLVLLDVLGDRLVVKNDATVLVEIVEVVVLSKLPELARFIRFEPYCLTLGAS